MGMFGNIFVDHSSDLRIHHLGPVSVHAPVGSINNYDREDIQ